MSTTAILKHGTRELRCLRFWANNRAVTTLLWYRQLKNGDWLPLMGADQFGVTSVEDLRCVVTGLQNALETWERLHPNLKPVTTPDASDPVGLRAYVEARIRDLQADARDAGRDPFATTAAKSGIWELRGVLDQLAEVSRPPHPTQGDEPMPGFHTDPNTIQKAADTPTAPTTLADLRARVQQRIEFCQHEATRAQQTPATVHHFETLAAELEWFLADIQALEQTEKNQLAALYADDALDRPGLLTDEQKQRNLEQLEAYTQEAQIPDGAPCRQVLRALQICASLWEPGARIQGNLRADDIVRACAEAITVLDALHNRA